VSTHNEQGEALVKRTRMLISALLAVLLAPAAMAQNADREGTWEFLFDVNYQDSYKVDFEGGSSADTDADLGFSLGANYHYNNRLQIQFSFDWLRLDYDATIQSGDIPPNASYGVRGEMESFTPRVNLVLNLLDRNFTPYISGGVGWSFIDTNIPTGPPQTGCWWHPWWGYLCTTYQNTRDTDELAYQAGVGLRWDVNRGLSLRLGYEKQWIDVGTATSAPGFDVIRFGLGYKY
jgi:opacity protein-like surface antigen